MTSPRWFIATNTDNFKFFYDCGLIVDRQAFPNNSYMHDMQSERPKGFLPCLSEDNLSEALKLAKREDENLTVCLVEIELKNIRFEHFLLKVERVVNLNTLIKKALLQLMPSRFCYLRHFHLVV
ncbi:MAG: hypothetical protein IPI79_12490 [Moraxellaceae bacterium]|nr:hypothetical protein [Moraxellaceae bacterium]